MLQDHHQVDVAYYKKILQTTYIKTSGLQNLGHRLHEVKTKIKIMNKQVIFRR
jgi:hypothetical protein